MMLIVDSWPRILDTAGKTDEENEELAQNTQVFGLMKYGLLKGASHFLLLILYTC